MSEPTLSIRRAEVAVTDPEAIAAALERELGGEPLAMVALFVPPGVPREPLREELARRFPDVPLVGCTTAGEIGPSGVLDGMVTGFALPTGDFDVAVSRLEHVSNLAVGDVAALVRGLLDELQAKGLRPSSANTFAMLLVDGLSAREEVVASAFDAALGGIRLFGGSAGDGLAFGETAVLGAGRFAPDAAVLALVHTRHPFRVFKSQHLEGTGQLLVVTAAAPEQRVVYELDGEPAADAYARVVGVSREALTPEIFARHAVAVRLGGTPYVRSIQRSNADGSLTFYCAIEEGLVLELTRGTDLVGTLEATFAELTTELGTPALVIGCDCILRRLEAARLDLARPIGEIFTRHRVVGFGTYGEQIGGLHVNQTFTGVAIGAQSSEAA